MASRSNAKPERVSYTFPSVSTTLSGPLAHPSANNCHCSGVNAVAVDSTRSIMYSAGRDSSIRAWSFGNHQILRSSLTRPSGASLPVRPHNPLLQLILSCLHLELLTQKPCPTVVIRFSNCAAELSPFRRLMRLFASTTSTSTATG